MADFKYEVTIPGSGTFEVQSQTPLSDAEAFNIAKQQAVPRTTGEQVQHLAGVAARGMAPPVLGAGAGFLATGGNPLGALAGSITLPLAELATQGVNLALPKGSQISSPSSAVENLLTKLGFAQPETAPERVLQASTASLGGTGSQLKFLQQLSQAAKSPVTRGVASEMAAAPGRQMAVAAPAGATAQTVSEATGSPLAGAAAGMVVGAAGGVGARGRVGETADQLAAQATAAYDKAAQSGLQFNNQDFRTSMAGIIGGLRQEGYSPTAYPKIEAITKELMNNRPKDFVELQALRKIIQGAQGSADATERMLATNLKDKFDEYVLNAPASHFAGTNTKDGVEAWKDARNVYSRMKKGEIFDEMLQNAELDKSKFTQSGSENSLAAQLRNLAKNKAKMRMFTPDEQDAITAAAKGGNVQNLLKFFGRFAPTSTVSAITPLAVTAYSPTLGTALTGGALAARAGATAMRRSSVERLADQMRLGAPIPSQIPVSVVTGARGLLTPQAPLDVTSEQLQQIYGQ